MWNADLRLASYISNETLRWLFAIDKIDAVPHKEHVDNPDAARVITRARFMFVE